MSLLQTKKDYEQYLSDNYTTTPVHWSGMPWDIKAQTEWVYFEYIGRAIEDCGFDNTEYNINGYLSITVVAETRFRVMEIADIIFALFKGQKISGTTTHSISIIDTGTITEINKSFMDFNIQIKMV